MSMTDHTPTFLVRILPNLQTVWNQNLHYLSKGPMKAKVSGANSVWSNAILWRCSMTGWWHRKIGLLWWQCSGLGLCLQYQHSIWALVLVLAALPPPSSLLMVWESWGNGPSSWASVPMCLFVIDVELCLWHTVSRDSNRNLFCNGKSVGVKYWLWNPGDSWPTRKGHIVVKSKEWLESGAQMTPGLPLPEFASPWVSLTLSLQTGWWEAKFET